ncbi:MAG: DUF1636 family protein [Nodosilinea sp.]
MLNPTLFICKSCNPVHNDTVDCNQSAGATLLQHLTQLQSSDTPASALDIRPVDCLWTCDHPCAVSFSAPGKATYLFTNIPATAAPDLLAFGTLYCASKAGNIPGQQVPEALQDASVAKIPPVCNDANQTE